jgi:hypothetical protein
LLSLWPNFFLESKWFSWNPRQWKNQIRLHKKVVPILKYVPSGKWFINDNKITRKAASNFSWSLIAFGYNNKKQFIMHNRQHTDQYGTKFFYFSVFSPCCTLLTKVRKCALLTSLRVCDFFVGICKTECKLSCGDLCFGVKIHQTFLWISMWS